MPTSRKVSKNKIVAQLQTIIRGVRTHMSGESFVINGIEYTADEVIAVLQREIDNLHASDAARQQWLNSVRHQVTGFVAETRPMIHGVRDHATARFGERAEELREFGFTPTRAANRTPESKVIAAEKLRATRKARGTMGKRQRAAIKGVVPELEHVTSPEQLALVVDELTRKPSK
jgi:hypothetical protein